MDRRLSLDGLRALAILVVVLYHAASRFFPGGWSGVDIFFVLSGFLITTVLRREIEQTGRISFSKFYVRRALRLAPALMFLLAFEVVRSQFASDGSEALSAVAVAATYVMNWSRAFHLFPQGVLGHTWSLSAEEQFYLIWPITLVLIAERGAIKWVAATLAIVMTWRVVLLFAGSGADRIYNGFDTHCDGFLVGCLLGLVGVEACRNAMAGLGGLGRHLLSPALPLASLALVVLLLPWGEATCAFGIAFANACSGWLIIAVYGNNWLERLLSSTPLAYTGKISYGWYLWHYPALSLAHRIHFGGWRQHVFAIAVIGGSYAIAALSYAYFEKPFLMWKRRFETKPVSGAGRHVPVLLTTRFGAERQLADARP
ncbi:MAG TPA: acyltransferase [Roseiarcus sp.]|nr:acyltransferase [Roseiarcus sp.]